MSERDYSLYLKDILGSCVKISSYSDGFTKKAFFKDSKTVDAVMRNIGIIGEAVKHLPAAFRRKHKDIEWKKIAGLRDIAIHEYFGVNKDIVWDVIKNKIPELRENINSIIEKETMR